MAKSVMSVLSRLLTDSALLLGFESWAAMAGIAADEFRALAQLLMYCDNAAKTAS